MTRLRDNEKSASSIRENARTRSVERGSARGVASKLQWK